MDERILFMILAIAVLFIIGFILRKIGIFTPRTKMVRRKLTNKEAEWVADYFHNDLDEPDEDGYVGRYTLPEEVMAVYLKKYGGEFK